MISLAGRRTPPPSPYPKKKRKRGARGCTPVHSSELEPGCAAMSDSSGAEPAGGSARSRHSPEAARPRQPQAASSSPRMPAGGGVGAFREAYASVCLRGVVHQGCRSLF